MNILKLFFCIAIFSMILKINFIQADAMSDCMIRCQTSHGTNCFEYCLRQL